MIKKRLIIINSPVTAFFISIKLQELKIKKENTKNIILYEQFKKEANTSKNYKKNSILHKKQCFFFLKNFKYYNLPIVNYKELKLKSIIADSLNFFYSRRTNLKKINNLINKLDLKKNENIEIWHGNTLWQYYLKKLFKNSTLTLFDHGLTESILELENFNKKKNIITNLKKKIKEILNKIFITTPFPIHDYHCTLLYKELLIIKKNKKFVSLNSKFFKLNYLKKINLKFTKSKNIALFLVSYIKPYSMEEKENMLYFKDLEFFFLDKIKPILQKKKIDTVFIKPHPWHDEFCYEWFKDFSKNNKDLNFFYLPRHYLNLPAELFLFFDEFKFIISPLSSANIFAKKIKNKVFIISYDLWFKKYLLDNFSNYYKDLDKIRLIFLEKFKKIFKFAIQDYNI
jgi:hypothetical protein